MLEKLKQARALIVRGWCQNLAAKNIRGESTGPLSPDACEWCMLGSLSAVTDGFSDLARLIVILGGNSPIKSADLSFWNDHPSRTKHQVLAVYDAAIEELEKCGRTVEK